MYTLTSNGQSQPFHVVKDDVHLSIAGDFGGGSVAVQYHMGGEWFPLMNSGVAVVLTSADNINLDVKVGDVIRLSLSGSSSPDIYFKISNTL